MDRYKFPMLVWNSVPSLGPARRRNLIRISSHKWTHMSSMRYRVVRKTCLMIASYALHSAGRKHSYAHGHPLQTKKVRLRRVRDIYYSAIPTLCCIMGTSCRKDAWTTIYPLSGASHARWRRAYTGILGCVANDEHVRLHSLVRNRSPR